MSQKYKNFSKGSKQASENISIWPPDVKRVGYLRKLKKMKRRFFVLYMDSEIRSSRLEYYSSEKKWKAGGEPRRCIELRFCLNISRKIHSKQKNVIVFYTQDDCFCVVADTAEELELWLNDILEVYRSNSCGDENSGQATYEHLWQVVIDKHDLECNQSLTGPYRVALSTKALILIKMSPSNKSDYIEFPLMSIRRCGHSKDLFFIELGRSAVTGAGEIYMATEGTLTAQNMHETVLSAMKSSKIREDGSILPRPRSASTSENSNPLANRRPIGAVASQTLTTSNSCVLSSSRERCDSLPTRPKTLIETSQNGALFSAVNSPYSASRIANQRLSSRPHSMYEWPCSNTFSARNTNFSPCSLSSAAGNSSSTEDMENLKTQNIGPHILSKPSDAVTPSDLPITEVPDEYLMMSPANEQCSGIKKCTNPDKGNFVSNSLTDSKDEKSTIPDQNIKPPKKIQETPFDQKTKNENTAFNSIKVSSGNSGKISPRCLNSRLQKEPKTCDSAQAGFICKSNLNVKIHNSNKIDVFNQQENIVPCLAPSGSDRNLNSNLIVNSSKTENVVKCIQIEENCETEDVSYFNRNQRTSDVLPSDQNTNFSCLVHSERSSKSTLPCAYLCSSDKTLSSETKPYALVEPKSGIKLKQKNIPSKCSASNSEQPMQFHSSNTFPGSKHFHLSARNEDAVPHSQDDYVNLEFKSTTSSNLCTNAHSFHLIPPHSSSDPNYLNIHLGKPFCPIPNPVPAKLETSYPSLKPDRCGPLSSNVNFTESVKSQKLPVSKDAPKPLSVVPKFRNIPNTLPAFRKQMSAPAAPPSLQPELPSPGRKSSCPVTASVSMIKSPTPVTTVAAMKPPFGGHLKVSSSRSPDHSSVSSISSASDEISSNHSSPKMLNITLNVRHNCSDSWYENVILPQKEQPVHVRSPSVSSEKELNYASLDLTPSEKEDVPSSPIVLKCNATNEEPLLYAEIDFTKSEGLKNTSGTLRDGRL